MAKRKKVMSLALVALSSIVLSGCAEVTQNSEGKVLEYTYNGEKLNVNTNDIIQKYLSTNKNDHAKAFYDALNEIVVRANFEKGGKLSDLKTSVEKSAKNTVEKAKDDAEDAGKSWEDYLTNTLNYNDETMSVEEKEKEYYLSSLYTEMTSKVDSTFYDTFKTWKDTESDELQKKYNLISGSEGYLVNYVPYHLKHILVKVDATQDYGYSRGHISSDNAHKLYQVVNNLVNCDGKDSTFTDVMKSFTDDSAGATKGEYIMTNQTSFVNEFKYGVYLYDLAMSKNKDAYKNEKDYSEKKNNLHINNEAFTSLTDFGVSFIPYGVIEQLETYKDTTTKNGVTVYGGDEDYLPRNILFNKYFQNRNVGFITYEDALTSKDLIGTDSKWTDSTKDTLTGSSYTGFMSATKSDKVDAQKTVYSDLNNEGHYKTSGRPASVNDKNFVEMTFTCKVDGVDTQIKKKVLCDTNKNPILVVRNKESSGGVHFIIIERSGFDCSDLNFKADTTAGTTEAYKANLNEYYAPVSPKDADGINSATGKPYYTEKAPHVTEKIEGKDVYIPKKTYVQTRTIGRNSNVDDTVNNYQERISNSSYGIEPEIKKSINSYNKFDWLNSGLNIKLNEIAGTNVEELVQKYIDKSRNSTLSENAKSLSTNWANYAAEIKAQNNERKYMLLPEILALEFGNEAIYKQGNPGYNSKYSNIDGKLNN